MASTVIPAMAKPKKRVHDPDKPVRYSMHEPTTAKAIHESLFGPRLRIHKRGNAGPARRHKPGCITIQFTINF